METGKKDSDDQSLGEEGMGSYDLTGMEFQFRNMKRFWRRMVVMVVQNVDTLNAIELHTFKWLKSKFYNMHILQ